MSQTVSKLYREGGGGAQAFYRGLSPCLIRYLYIISQNIEVNSNMLFCLIIRAFPTAAGSFVAFEYSSQWLKGQLLTL